MHASAAASTFTFSDSAMDFSLAADQLVRDRPQVEALAAREDRREHLLHLGRRKDELHVRRRLLEGLQEGVERGRREHVHLVDDVDLELSLRGHVAGRLAQVAHLVDAVVRGAVDLDHVQVAPLGDRDDRGIRGVKVGVGPARAVEGLREDPRDRGLARAPRPDEKVGVRRSGPARSRSGGFAPRGPGRRRPRTSGAAICAR